MLFLYRPRQTYMPFRLPRHRTQQDEYNAHLQQTFAATHRVAPQEPSSAERDPIAALKELAALHESGMLSDEELAAAKARVLGGDTQS
jgi:hypothetical protein